MHAIFVVLLVGVLAGAVVCFVVMGLSQARRARRLTGRAGELSLRFDRDDPFDVPRRYAAFAIIGGGHGPYMHNMTHGRIGGRSVRMFDFHYEIGHGARRITRHYGLIVMELEQPLGPILMWHDADIELAPLAARQGASHVRCWSYSGEDEQAARIAACAQPLEALDGSLQIIGTTAMVCVPIRSKSQDYAKNLQAVAAMLTSITGIRSIR